MSDSYPCLTAGKSMFFGNSPVLTIDKLSLVFDVPSLHKEDYFSKSFYKILFYLLADSERELNETKIFEYNVIYNGVYVSWGRGIESDSKLRIEFNPSKLKLAEISLLLQLIGLRRLQSSNISRIDVAIDYGRKLNPLAFFDKFIRKHSVYWGKDSGAQSVYLGSKKSDKFIRIYDKRLEQKESFNVDVDGSWWRVEAEIRSGFYWLSSWYYDPKSNPFKNLSYVEKFYFKNDNYISRLAENFILHNGIQAFIAICDKQDRQRVKKRIEELRTNIVPVENFEQPCEVFQKQFVIVWGLFKNEIESIANSKPKF